jgi:hypothetical protein
MPGAERSTQYPSTVAYIATLLLHRYKVLGILDDEGRAIQSAGIWRYRTTVKLIDHESAPIKGKVCPSCSAAADDQARTAASSVPRAASPAIAVDALPGSSQTPP